MKFSEAAKDVCLLAGVPLTPQEIREKVKANYPQFYNTPAHARNVEKGHYQDLDHALLAQIYITVGSSDKFICDKTCKPMKISLNENGKQSGGSKIDPNRSSSALRSHNQVDYSEKVFGILENAAKYHEAYYQAEVFSGPSLYFHRKAISGRNSPVSAQTLKVSTQSLLHGVCTEWAREGQKCVTLRPFRKVWCLWLRIFPPPKNMIFKIWMNRSGKY